MKFLMQVLVTRAGLTVEECAAIVTAWNTIAQIVKPLAVPVPEKKEE